MDLCEPDIDGATRPGALIPTHLVGVDRRMAGLARWLNGQGYAVSGPSESLRRRIRDHARVDGGHSATPYPRLLLYGPDVSRAHPDRLTALRHGVPQSPIVDVFHEVLRTGVGIAVAGRRQGRVAAAMIGWTLAHAGYDPTLLLRGDLPRLAESTQPVRGRFAVVDIDETLEIILRDPPGPAIALLLDVARLVESEALEQLVECVGPTGHVIAASVPPAFGHAIEGRPARVETLSLERGSTWWGADLREDRGRFRFRAFHEGRFAVEIRLRVPGRASVLSALAAVAVCRRVEVPTREIRDALEDFDGVSRGFESRGSYRGVTLVDDDAVEPPDVADALDLARTIHGRRRIWVVFAPGGPARVETARALGRADRIMLVDASVDAGPWASMLGEIGVSFQRVADSDEALKDLDRHLEPGDVLLTLGAGDVGTIADAFLRRLPRDRQGR
jgi:UDP-N-acetylmuramate--alanine ligase